MRAYTVHAPPGEPQPERFAFVKDGFSWPALFIPPLWMLWRRMWVALLGTIAFVLVVAVIDAYVGDPFDTIVAIAGALILGFEGNNIRRASLASRGWRDVGSAAGGNLEEAEISFFAGWAEASPQLPRDANRPAAAYSAQGAAVQSEEPILGLFPEPER